MMHTRRRYNGQLDQKEIENHFIVVQRELENWAYKKANASPKNSKQDFRVTERFCKIVFIFCITAIFFLLISYKNIF